MILAPLAGAALVVSAAFGPLAEPTHHAPHLSEQQKTAALQPLIRSATDCVAHAVSKDARFQRQADLRDLIVDAMAGCVGPVRAMIDRYDSYFGDGAGEAFFTGPYLDVLPNAVSKWVADRTD